MLKRGGAKCPLRRSDRCIDHFWLHGQRLANGCLEWDAGTSPGGYGKVKVNNRHVTASRYAYELATGRQLSPDAKLDHVCHNSDLTCPGGKACRHRRCIEPTHLEPVTHPENLHRSPHWSGNQTHCVRGHALSGANLLNTKQLNARGLPERICRTCHRDYERKRKLAAAEATPF